VTQSPYVPSNGGQDQDPQTGEWSSTGSSASAGFDPAAPYGQFDEPVTGSTATTGYSTSTGGTSTTDAAKGEAGELKDTAVDRGQQVAGVAKEQAGAVKDTALDRGQQVAGVAKEQAGAVKDTALDRGHEVVEVAKDEVSRVTSQATSQARDLISQGRSEISSQATAQQQRLGGLVHSFADELGTMAAKSDKQGPITDLAQQGSKRLGAIAHRLENSEPTDLLNDLRTFARRRPGIFLASSALAGVLAGRLSRSFASQAHDTKVANESPALSAPASSGYDSSAYATGGYESGSYGTAGTYDTGSYDTGGVAPRRTASLEEIPTSGTGAGGTSYDPQGYDATTVYDDTVDYEPGRGDGTR
jgi:hypothetical protein